MSNKHYQFSCGCKFPILGNTSDDRPKITFNPSIEHIPLDCQYTWDLISDGNTKGVFQLETKFAQGFAKKLKPRNIEHLSGLVAVLRPGCLESIIDGKSITLHYIDRKNGEEEITYFHPALEPILSSTYGMLIFQEESMRIASDIAGFTLEESDSLRKCIAKGSIVYTQNGPRAIEDICYNSKIKAKILSIDTNNKLCYVPIKKVWSSGIKQTYKLKTEKGFEISVTDNHQIYTQNGWIDLKYIQIGDFVVIPNNYTYKGNNKNITPEMSVILSYIISEGHHSNKETKITNSDIWILNIIRQYLKISGIKYTEYSNKRNDCIDLFINQQDKRYFDKILPIAKSRHKIIPPIIANAQKGITRPFIGHYFSAEGTVSDINISISSTSKKIINVLQALILRDGIHSYIHTKNGKYKGMPYISYELIIGEQSDISKFKNVYKDHICPRKLKSIDKLLSHHIKYANSRFLVPECFIKASTKNKNLNAIFGNVSGSMYKSNMTYERASRLNQILQSDILENILDAGFKFTKVTSIVKDDEVETFDYEVDNHSINYGFINGILVHNSIGKKKPELMAKVKTKFLTGCKNKGIVTEDEAKEIFNWIEKSQKYQFNKSHSVSYALNAYISAYTKAHFPKAFFTSYLYYSSEKQKPHEEINELINNAKLNNIIVSLPSILTLNKHFKLYDKAIYFGLTDIKGVGDKVCEKLFKVINSETKPIEKYSWIEFLLKISPRVNSTAIKNIILTGGLSHFTLARNLMLYEYEIYMKLSDREQRWCINSILEDDSLLNVLKRLSESPPGKDGGCANKNRLIKVKELVDLLESPPYSLDDKPAWIAGIEESLLGIPLTQTGLESCDINSANCTCKDFLQELSKAEIMLIPVQVDKVKEIKTKRGKNPGQKMSFVAVSDITGQMDIVAFPDVWKDCKRLLVEGNQVMISGERGKEKDSFILKKVYQI